MMWLFAASNHAYLGSVGLLLFQVCTRPSGAQGVSLRSQRIMLVAITSRMIFAYKGASFHNFIELCLTSVVSAVLLLLLEPKIARLIPHPAGGQFTGALPDKFPPVDKMGIIVCVSVVTICWLTDRVQDKISMFLIAANSLQALALLPQRELLVKTRSLPALTSHAFMLASASAALRLLMWLMLCLEHEFHTYMMLPDFLHIGLIADFALIYVRAMRAQGIEGVFRQQNLQMLPFTAV